MAVNMSKLATLPIFLMFVKRVSVKLTWSTNNMHEVSCMRQITLTLSRAPGDYID